MGCDVVSVQGGDLPVIVQGCGLWHREISDSFEVLARSAIFSIQRQSSTELDEG